MNRDKLIQDLIAKGMTAEVATTTADEILGQIQPPEPAADVSALTKAIQDAASIQRDTEGATPPAQASLDLSSFDAAAAEALVKSITQGADQLLHAHREQNATLAKSLVVMGEEIKAIRQENADLRKGMADVLAALNVPEKPRSILTTQQQVVPPPAADGERMAPSDYVAKAQAKLDGGTLTQPAADALRKSLSLVYSPGVDVKALATKHGLV